MRYVCLLTSVFTAVAALNAQMITPEAQALIKEYATALGIGKPAPARLRAVILEGEGEYRGINQRATAPFHIEWQSPNNYQAWMKAPFGRIERVISGNSGYGVHPQTGRRTLSPQEMVEVWRERAMYQPLWWLELYTRIELAPPATAEGHSADVLIATTKDGQKERLLFRRDTHLPVQLEVWEEGPEGIRAGEPLLVTYKLSDYRDVSGLRLPFQVRRIRPNSEFVYRFSSIQVTR